jgi:hypothetical protein
MRRREGRRAARRAGREGRGVREGEGEWEDMVMWWWVRDLLSCALSLSLPPLKGGGYYGGYITGYKRFTN